MPSAGFELTISASERPQTHALDRAATGTNGHNAVPIQNRTHVYVKLFDHKDLENHVLQ